MYCFPDPNDYLSVGHHFTVYEKPSFLRAHSMTSGRPQCSTESPETGRVRQHCLPTAIVFYRASLAPLAFVTHTSCGRAKIPKLLQYIFLVFQDLILSKWTLLWSTILVILIQEWPRWLLGVLFSEDKVNAKIFTYVAMIVGFLEDGKWYISMFRL